MGNNRFLAATFAAGVMALNVPLVLAADGRADRASEAPWDASADRTQEEEIMDKLKEVKEETDDQRKLIQFLMKAVKKGPLFFLDFTLDQYYNRYVESPRT